MTRVARALRIVAVQARASLLVALQYRADFALDAVLEIASTATALVPLWIVFGHRPGLSGATPELALAVAGTFAVVQGLAEGAITPSLASVVEHVRSGTLDFVLLRPADAQVLLSASRVQPFRLVNVLTGSVLVGVALHRAGHAPTLGEALAAASCLLAGIVIVYAITLFAVTASFFAVRVDNLAYLVGAVLDAGRWPSRVFRGAVRFAFTFVFPLAVMTSFPAEALLGSLAPASVPVAVALAATFAVASRLAFVGALRRYASASS